MIALSDHEISHITAKFPLVSVGLPTYNRPEGLKRCLTHLLNQTYSNIEIIISDNCSAGSEVQDIIVEFAGKDNRIKHFRQAKNIGLESNFNFVFSQSSAPYFIWMSDDDYFDNDYIEKCVFFLQGHPEYVLCSGAAEYYSGKEFLFEESMFSLDQKSAVKRIFKYFSHVGKNGSFYGVFRKYLVDNNPLGEHIGCDWVFMARLAILGKLTFLESIKYYRSAEGHSTSRRSMIKKFRFNFLQSLFFETYTAYIISKNVFKRVLIKKQFSIIYRMFISTAIFFLLNWKFLKDSVARRLKK